MEGGLERTNAHFARRERLLERNHPFPMCPYSYRVQQSLLFRKKCSKIFPVACVMCVPIDLMSLFEAS